MLAETFQVTTPNSRRLLTGAAADLHVAVFYLAYTVCVTLVSA